MPRQNRIIALIVGLTVILGSLTAAVPARATTLIDVAGHWAASEIATLVANNVIKGYDDGTFRPNKPVTRAEFVTMLNRAAGLTAGTYDGTFGDVKAADWYAGDVATAVASGYIRGYDDGSFGPKKNITRNEVAVVLTRAMALRVSDPPTPFSDANAIPDWAADYVQAAAQAGFIKGYDDGSFGGGRNLTRAEAAVLISRARTKLVDYLTKPQVGMEVFGYSNASVGVLAQLSLALYNDGAALPENVAIDITVTGSTQPMLSSDVDISFIDRNAGISGAVSYHLSADRSQILGTIERLYGIPLPAKYLNEIGLDLMFERSGDYDLHIQVRGATSGNIYGQPLDFTLNVSDLSVSARQGGALSGCPQTVTVAINNTGDVEYAEPVIPVLIIAKQDGTPLPPSDVELYYHGPTSREMVVVQPTVDVTGTNALVAMLSGPQGIVVPAKTTRGDFGPVLTYTIKEPTSGSYVFGVMLVGVQSLTPIGAPAIYDRWVGGIAKSTALTKAYFAPVVNAVAGESVDTWLMLTANDWGPYPESAKIRLTVTGPGIQPGDVNIAFYDFPSDSYLPVKFTAAGPDTLVGTWTQSWQPSGTTILATAGFHVMVSGKAGHYVVGVEIVGASGKVYGSMITTEVDFRQQP